MSSKWGTSPFDEADQNCTPIPGYSSPETSASGKKVTQSKTFWSGITVSSLSVLSYLQGLDFIQHYPAIIAGIGVAIGIGMIVLRYFTDQPMQPPSVIIRPKQMPNNSNNEPSNRGGLWGR